MFCTPSRLSRSKSRAKSADRGMIQIDPTNPRMEVRSISADRSLNNNSANGSGPLINGHNSHAHAAPAQRLVVPTLDQSRRSSLSESSAISGFSTASGKTYVHEASTLVLETLENGVKKWGLHYKVRTIRSIIPKHSSSFSQAFPRSFGDRAEAKMAEEGH